MSIEKLFLVATVHGKDLSVPEVLGSFRERGSNFSFGGLTKMSSFRGLRYCKISPKLGRFLGSLQHLDMREEIDGCAPHGICSLAFPHPTAPTTCAKFPSSHDPKMRPACLEMRACAGQGSNSVSRAESLSS